MCEVCQGQGTDYAHRIGRSITRWRWDPRNALWLCRPCHARSHRFPEVAYADGIRLQSWQNPATEPFQSITGLWLISEDGRSYVQCHYPEK